MAEPTGAAAGVPSRRPAGGDGDEGRSGAGGAADVPPGAAAAGTTPVERRTQEEERAHLERLLSSAPPTVLAASDLHLSAGRDPTTGVFDARENFFAAGAFRRWVRHHAGEAGEGGLLVLNGDIFDFVRVTRIPSTDADYALWRERLLRLGEDERARSLRRPVEGGERDFGLRTHDYRTLWKLLVVFRGHPEFFEALAEWIEEGGRLVVVAGNHDPELYWPLVRQAIGDELVRHGASPGDVMRRMAFAHEPFWVGGLYFEHGHQYEAMTRIDAPPVLEFAPSQIRLPLGSFVNRYFINHIERLDPFIDNIKPVQSALLELLRRRPLRILYLYARAAKFVRRALAIPRPFSRAYAVLAAGSLGLPLLTVTLLAATIFLPGFREWLFDALPVLTSPWAQIGGAAGGMLFPALLPYLVSAGREVLRMTGVLGDEDPLRQGAEEVLRSAVPGPGSGGGRIYAVMGHTHRQTVVHLGEIAGVEAFYVNAGTWIPLWPKDREDLTGQVIYSFARFDRTQDGSYEHSAGEWDDAAGAARPARILGPWQRG